MKNLTAASHSGNMVLIRIDGTNGFVDKCCVTNLERFHKSIDKQKRFESVTEGKVSVAAAPILKEYQADNSHTVTMPYIHGLNGEDFAVYGDRDTALHLKAGLNALLRRTFSACHIQQVSARLFTEKLEAVIKTTESRTMRTTLSSAMRRIESLLENADTLAFPSGENHGDLTLSNIIYQPQGKIHLIDFLDSFLESPLQDVAKITQDFSLGWSFRHLPEALQTKATIFCRQAHPEYAKVIRAQFPRQVHILEILCLARIAPYVRDDATANWLTKAFASVLSLSFTPSKKCPQLHAAFN